MINKNWIEKGLIVLLLVVFVSVPIEAISLKEAEDLLELAYNRGNFTCSYILEIENIVREDGEEDRAHLKVYLYQAGEKQLATFVGPERLRDQRYLVVGYNTWMYQDGLRRPIRVSANQRLFGDAGIGETVGLDYYNDYGIKGVSREDKDYILELKANERAMVYQRAKVRITNDGYFKAVILKDSGGTQLRKVSYQEYRDVNGHRIADLIIEDLLQNRDRKTELRYIDIVEKDLPSRLFQSNRMGDIELILNQL
ncbi:outer membrane lipoprotein-sorting protein [Halonatronum saccharophilum]|uniref:outer membrane lipoprotein-sorting protein n=1 Tax=Halonatronum saccharophilum TaxID=150060 RepID=UPI00048898DC|nr:outer membrane lipoprotein-sorting protein [Halonatronum saccharophilum]